MAKLPTNFNTHQESPDQSPTVSDEETPVPLVTQTVGHPYMAGKVRMRRKPQQDNLENNEEGPNLEMMSLKIELDKAKSELNRRTVLFSNHYNDMVGKWQNEKTKREVAETVAVEKARDNVVLQRTQLSLKMRAKQSTETALDPTQPDGEESRERSDTLIEGDVVNLTEQNEKQNLELQDLKDTVTLLEDQIAEHKRENENQSLDIEELTAKLIELENELKQSKSYMQSAQHQYKNLAGKLQDEKGKREIAENVAVNKARELEVQKRTSVMFMSSLTQSFNPDNFAEAGPHSSVEALDYATKISTLETEVEDLKESKVTLENALTKIEQDCFDKDIEIKQLRERLHISSFTRSPLEDSLAVTQSVATNKPSYGEYDKRMSRLSSETISPLLLQSISTGPGSALTLNRTKSKLSGIQSKEQLQQELKSKEAMINIMKLKLEKMKLEGSKDDPELEVERRELEDQVGGLDRKLSSMNTDDKKSETEVDELREKLESVEKKAADFEEKTRYYQELLNKMNRSSDNLPSPRTSPTPDSSYPVNIPPPPPNLPPPPPPPLPEGLFGPATPSLVIASLSKKSSRALQSGSKGETMNELMTMLSSGKVHLKKAKNKVPAPREEPSPLILPKAKLRRQITAPDDTNPLTSSFEDINPYYPVKSTGIESIDERLRQSRRQRDSTEQGKNSELLKKLNRRLKTSEPQSDETDTVQVPKIDSDPLPSLNTYQPTPVKRKITPVATQSPVRSPGLTRKMVEIESIAEEKEIEQLSPPPIPEKRSPKQTNSPILSPQKRKSESPLIKQSSVDNPNLPSIKSKPSLKGPILPPSNREFVPITAKRELKMEKSGSIPPISTKPTNIMGLLKSSSVDKVEKPRAATDLETEDSGSPLNKNKLKIPQVFAKK
ncbi:hypothetical protein LOD99_13916 [Oopsacas minuta]|uniref:Shootin-1 n=1 Tax=Oopsacas minuta TaxID=111878 RepID=A0AAV7KGB2_9METZ|nr:hypothetical protein LOD99_13916 [Oopsacas minuta]